MQKLEDIILKKGDIIYFDNGTSEIIGITSNNMTLKEYQGYVRPIIKIERPVKYETIYEAPKQIITQKEKEYLEAVIRPFKDKVQKIIKQSSFGNENLIVKIRHFDTNSNDYLEFPEFKAKSIYKGMELDKEYTLEELGLFEEVEDDKK